MKQKSLGKETTVLLADSTGLRGAEWIHGKGSSFRSASGLVVAPVR